MLRHSRRNRSANRIVLDARPAQGRRHSQMAEQLEDRTLLAAFVVNTTNDTPDADPGDGFALDANGETSLRAAIDEAEALPGADSITIPSAGVYTIGENFTIEDDLSITGFSTPDVILDSGGVGKHMFIFSADVTISGVTLTGGSADPTGGGAIGNYGGNLVLSEVRITDNEAVSGGGGGGVTFALNFADGAAPQGSLTIIDSTIDNNLGGRGGGLSVENGAGPVFIANSTISGNLTNTDGGGIYYYQNDNSLIIRNSTITGNSVNSNDTNVQIGGGIYVEGFPAGGDPVPLLHNTIVAGNTRGIDTPIADDINGTGGGPLIDPSSSFNLIGDAATSGGLTHGVNSNMVGVMGSGTIDIATVLDTALSDNGGSTPTHTLVVGSPAVDAGSSPLATGPTGSLLSSDQRGAGRFIDGDGNGENKVDIGAVEAPPGSGGSTDRFDDLVGRASTGTIVLSASTGTSFTSKVIGGVPPSVDWDDFRFGDFNGDGLLDAAGRSPSDGGWRVLLNNGVDGYDSPVIWATWAPGIEFTTLLVGDFNNDGLDDVAGRAISGTWLVGLSTGSSFGIAVWGGWSTAVTWSDIQIGDFDNDGRDDIIGRASSGTWVMGRSTGSSFASTVFGGWSTFVTWDFVKATDLNGDGRTDIVGRASSGTWVAGLSTGTTFAMAVWGGWSTNVTWSSVVYGDFNADGNTDVVGRASTGTIVVGLSNGSKFDMSVFGGLSTAVSWPQAVAGDFNGDGFDDLAMRASSGTWVVGLSNGTSFVFSIWGGWSTAVTWDNVFAGEFAVI